jgi:hypothetical protein
MQRRLVETPDIGETSLVMSYIGRSEIFKYERLVWDFPPKLEYPPIMDTLKSLLIGGLQRSYIIC